MFRKLQLELGSGKLDDAVALHVFIQGLKPFTRQQVLLQRPANLQLAIQLADRAEGVVRYTQKGGRSTYRSGHGSSSRGGYGSGTRGGYSSDARGGSSGGYRNNNSNGISQYGDHKYKGEAPMALGSA